MMNDAELHAFEIACRACAGEGFGDFRCDEER
jgi:hypothetical protein